MSFQEGPNFISEKLEKYFIKKVGKRVARKKTRKCIRSLLTGSDNVFQEGPNFILQAHYPFLRNLKNILYKKTFWDCKEKVEKVHEKMTLSYQEGPNIILQAPSP